MMKKTFVLGAAVVGGLLLSHSSAAWAGETEDPQAGSPWRIQAPIRFQDRLSIGGAATAGLHPLSLVSADFDEDGMVDLVSGWRDEAGQGRLELFRGNLDFLFPKSPEALAHRQAGTFVDSPFPGSPIRLTLTVAPDFLASGDFDADGHPDLVAAERGGGRIVFLRGDGKGNLTETRTLSLEGEVSSLTSGDGNRPDGLIDIFVGVRTAAGARLLVFEAPEGALARSPEEIPLPAVPLSMALGRFGTEDYWPDLAVAAGPEIVIVHGRDRGLSIADDGRPRPAAPRIESIPVDSTVLAVATGKFSDFAEGSDEIAAFLEDGSLRVFGHDDMTDSWSEQSRLAFAVAKRTRAGRPFLARTLNTAKAGNDLLLFDGIEPKLRLLSADAIRSEKRGLRIASAERAESGLPVAVLPLRLNPDGLSDLVVLGNSPAPLSADLSAPMNIYTVSTNAPTGPGSLDQAIRDANAHAGLDQIVSTLPTSPGEIITVVAGGLPTINSPVVLDGFNSGAPSQIELDGSGQGAMIKNGLNFNNAAGSVVRGFQIDHWTAAGVAIGGAGNVAVETSFLGANFPNAGDAVAINQSAGSTIGPGNDIWNNTGSGVLIFGAAATGNTVKGNYIGVNQVDAPAPNGGGGGFGGIRVLSAGGNSIGGSIAGFRNVISANTGPGIFIQNGAANLVQGNYIGTNRTGTVPLGNSSYGVRVSGANQTTIGGTTPAAGNVISGNAASGIVFQGTSTNALVQGNYIGTAEPSAPAVIANSGDGVRIESTVDTATVGGTASGAGNVISGNTSDGVQIDSSLNPVVAGNWIGTDRAGTTPLPNIANGVYFTAGGGICTIGGTAAGAGNVISKNAFNGIQTTGENCVILGNWIGTNSTGTLNLGNGQVGILSNSNFSTGTIGNTTGGKNVIAFNFSAGIYLGANPAIAPKDDEPGFAGIPRPSAVNAQFLCRGNSIYQNGGLGIDLYPTGVTPNDPNDQDGGPNDLLNFPVVTSSLWNGSSTIISGVIDSNPGVLIKIDVYSNVAADISGNGEGKNWLSSVDVTTDGTGHATWGLSIPSFANWISATSSFGNTVTSEFGPTAPTLTGTPVKEASLAGNMMATKGSGTSVNVAYTAACGALGHAVYQGTDPIASSLGWTSSFCGYDAGGSLNFDPGDPPGNSFWYFVVVGQNLTAEGSYGKDSSAVEEPEAVGLGICDIPQNYNGSCT